MGLFSTSSRSKNETHNTYNTTTNTSTDTRTNIGEIGLTGQAAVTMADIVNETGYKMLDSANKTNQENLKTQVEMGRLIIGGSGNTINRSFDYSQGIIAETTEKSLSTAKQTASDIVSVASSQSGQILSRASSSAQQLITGAGNIVTSENKNLIPMILIGVVGIVFAMKKF